MTILDTITKKNGRQVVLALLPDFVLQREDEDQLEEEKEHYVTWCPFDDCSTDIAKSTYTRKRLYKLFITKDLSVGYCQRCHRAFVNVDERLHLDTPLPDIFSRDNFSLVKLDARDWKLDMYREDFKPLSDEGKKYLLSKNPRMERILQPLGIKSTKNAVVFPFFYEKELIYFQLRFIEVPQGGIKYFSPPIARKPIYIIRRNLNNGKYVIVEGVRDAIACLFLYPDRTPIAILGSSMSTYQIWMLRRLFPKDILVHMDKTELSLAIKNEVKAVIDYAVYNITPSDGVDPEELLLML